MAKIAPTVVIREQRQDGTWYEVTWAPPGWVWVLAFAVKGVPWAVKEAETEDFKRIVAMWRHLNEEPDYCI